MIFFLNKSIFNYYVSFCVVLFLLVVLGMSWWGFLEAALSGGLVGRGTGWVLLDRGPQVISFDQCTVFWGFSAAGCHGWG